MDTEAHALSTPAAPTDPAAERPEPIPVHLEIEELGWCRVLRGGWPRLKLVLLTVIKSGLGWTIAATLLVAIGRGWRQIPQNAGDVLLFTFVGVMLGLCDHLLRSLWVVVAEDEVMVREGSSSYSTVKRYPRSAVREVSIHCWQKRNLLLDVEWHAALKVQWVGDEPPLDIRGTALGVERSVERLAEIYPVVEQDIPPPNPGTSERERAEKERAEIARMRELGLGHVCWRYGILPTTATLIIIVPLLTVWLADWRFVWFGVGLGLLGGPFLGCFWGVMAWWLLDKKLEILEREWPE